MNTTDIDTLVARADAPQAVRRHRPAVNITPIERAGRVVIGLAAGVVALILLTTATLAVAVAL